jgi:small-conductance mechanosensitive channel
MDAELQKVKLEAEVELAKLEATSPAKEVAGKAIGKFGLASIVTIVVIGVLASLWLEESKMAAVMGLLGASLTA